MMSLITRILEHEVKARGISNNQLAKEVGVSSKTIKSVMNERSMDLQTAKAICDWLGAPLSILSDHPPEWKVALVIYTLNSNPDLKKKWSELGNLSFKEILSPENIRTLMSFVEYRADLEKHVSSAESL